MKKIITIVSFQIGVNIIGLPIFWDHDISKAFTSKSNYIHKSNDNFKRNFK
jgi:hypothetical protein